MAVKVYFNLEEVPEMILRDIPDLKEVKQVIDPIIHDDEFNAETVALCLKNGRMTEFKAYDGRRIFVTYND